MIGNAPLPWAAIFCLACTPAGAMIKHHFSLVFRFCFGKWEPPKGEKAQLNGSHGSFRSTALVQAAAVVRCFQCDHTNQMMAANSTTSTPR